MLLHILNLQFHSDPFADSEVKDEITGSGLVGLRKVRIKF